MITLLGAKSLFNYNSDTGILTYAKTGHRRFGKVVGIKDKEGYIRISVSGIQYKVHRIIWLMAYGVWPKNEIDHINGIRDDNRLSNLRGATRLQNARNRKSSYAMKGITFYRDKQKFAGRIRYENKVIHLGYFDCPAAAHFAYIVAATKYHGEFARFR